MADNDKPAQPAAGGSENLQEDPVTGEKISKSECTTSSFNYAKVNMLIPRSQATNQAARSREEEGRESCKGSGEGKGSPCSTQEGKACWRERGRIEPKCMWKQWIAFRTSHTDILTSNTSRSALVPSMASAPPKNRIRMRLSPHQAQRYLPIPTLTL